MTETDRKGSYGKGRLSISKGYLFPRSRGLMNWIGLGGVLAFAAYFAFSLLFRSGEFAAGGPLSSSHSTFENDCDACHRTLAQKTGAGSLATGGAEDRNCMVCHGGLKETVGTYSFPRHYVYTSGDSTGLARSIAGHRELPCASCHTEHKGRNAAITRVPDSKCVTCHDYGSFNKNHPQFDFVAESVPDDSTLIFTHVRHSKEVQKAFALSRPCEYCHRLADDGKNFEPVDFDTHCRSCHLNGAQGSPAFAVLDPTDPGSVGVETPDMIQKRGEPGTLWAQTANPNEYKVLAGRVRKTVVTHRDPWILENLRQIRNRVYPGLGIAGVLDTYGLASNENSKVLYREAADVLDDHANALNTRQELGVKQDLSRIRGFLNATRSLLDREDTFPSADPFTVPFQTVNRSLSPEKRAELLAFADTTLGSLCRECHVITNAAISRVQKRQTALTRSIFDHAPHLLTGECLDCHASIPLDPEQIAEFNPETFDWSRDRSAIQNLPEIQNCRGCHSSRKASADCVTCHVFHPVRLKPVQMVRMP